MAKPSLFQASGRMLGHLDTHVEKLHHLSKLPEVKLAIVILDYSPTLMAMVSIISTTRKNRAAHVTTRRLVDCCMVFVVLGTILLSPPAKIPRNTVLSFPAQCPYKHVVSALQSLEHHLIQQ
eukprot:2029019-Amphidinium_carterae.1